MTLLCGEDVPFPFHRTVIRSSRPRASIKSPGTSTVDPNNSSRCPDFMYGIAFYPGLIQVQNVPRCRPFAFASTLAQTPAARRQSSSSTLQ